ncbi:MAG: hypothetical protein KF862_14220 [Chitinophagaceae bacterium]|nr:hypothetical protein [Chitinophagaceae bacterium]
MKMNFFSKTVIAAGCVALFAVSCKKESAKPEDNDNEIITTVELHFTEQGTGSSLTYKWEDLDGDGGNAPVISEIVLAPEKVYDVQIVLLDKTKTPVEDITEEVEEEAADHRFYFIPSGESNITIDDLNNDSDGIPLGITSRWTTAAAANGSVNIVLRHYPDGGKAANDLVSSSKSSTDADVTFSTKIQ